ncbi:MAG: ARMT1-like domain-containing protein [Thiovulaceae bacterium]|nr:ARMT1-like domain-containing protein [Sulfurimonadaceae bacterium]
MKIDNACVECIINQSRRVTDAIRADEALSSRIVSHVEALGENFDFTQSPPEVASDVYEQMAKIAAMDDLYGELKAHATEKAKTFLPQLHQELENSSNKLLTAIKISVAGNVIDLAAEVTFDLNEEMEQIFETDFAHDDVALLEKALKNSSTLLYIGDNVGEHIFDYLCIETLQKLYPELEIFYMVRGNPIINDVTMVEAKEAGFEKLCKLVDSGVNTPGFVYERANEASRKLFDEADLVLTKGMGNYECLSPSPRPNLCYLLKVKCSVVAASLGQNVGDIVCRMN